MTIVVPNGGEEIILNYVFNKDAPEDLDFRLYTSNLTPAETDTATTYTTNEAAGGGYAEIALTGADFTVTPGAPSSAAAAQQTWTFTGALTASATIYGYFVTRATTADLLYAERGPASLTPATNGDTYKVTPQFTMD